MAGTWQGHGRGMVKGDGDQGASQTRHADFLNTWALRAELGHSWILREAKGCFLFISGLHACRVKEGPALG